MRVRTAAAGRHAGMRHTGWHRTVSALGIIEIFAWGSTFYLMAVLAAPIGAETGWGAGLLSGGVSCGLLLAGLAAPTVGRLIDAEGGRRVLACGILLLGCGLVLLGTAASKAAYFIAWAVLGLGMAASLYDAAFSTLGRLFGRDARAAITQLTLWGGFASTVCWPISAFLVEHVGWRGACFAYAALHLAVMLPLCVFALPRSVPVRRVADPGVLRTSLPGVLDPRFLCLVVAGVAFTMLSTIWSVHLITILTAQGYQLAAAIGLGALIGPSQVGARVLEMLGRGRYHPIWTMGSATGLLLLGFLGLLIDIPAAAALVAYGAGNGLWSIARGSLPLALFGPDRYAETMGRLAMPMLLAGAAAPTVGAYLINATGPDGTLAILCAAATAPCLAALTLAALLRRRRRMLPAL